MSICASFTIQENDEELQRLCFRFHFMYVAHVSFMSAFLDIRFESQKKNVDIFLRKLIWWIVGNQESTVLQGIAVSENPSSLLESMVDRQAKDEIQPQMLHCGYILRIKWYNIIAYCIEMYMAWELHQSFRNSYSLKNRIFSCSKLRMKSLLGFVHKIEKRDKWSMDGKRQLVTRFPDFGRRTQPEMSM